MKKSIEDLYLKLIEDTILSKIHPFTYADFKYNSKNILKNFIKFIIIKLFNKNSQRLVLKRNIKDNEIENGLIRASNSYSMIGKKRLVNIKTLINSIIHEKIEGDLIEAGIWKGGVLIYMRACLKVHNDERNVFGADSFMGLPEVDDVNFPDDKIYKKILKKGPDMSLIVDKKNVVDNLEIFNFNDDKTILLEGWFENTLKDSKIKKLALLRIDGDMYKSTYEVLDLLYEKVSKNGYIVVDDYGLKSQACKKAVDDFRNKHNITNKINYIDWSGIYWKK